MGLLSFTFGAGFVPGVCNVEGRSSAVAGTLAITVYRPSDVTLDVDRSVMNASVNSSPWLGHAYDSSQLQVIDVGPYSLKFNGGNAVLEYSVEGRSGTLSLTRQSPF